MKKSNILFYILFVVTSVLYSQNYSSGIGLTGGITQDGYGALANYNYYIDRDDFVQAGLYLSFANDEYEGEKIPYNLFAFHAGYFKTIWKSRNRSFALSIGGGGIAGYEIINNGEEELPTGALIENNSKFIYGLYGGVEMDYYLSEKVSLLLKANQYYHINSELGELVSFGGIGIRYFLF